MNSKGHSIGDRMIYMNELHSHAASLYRRPRISNIQFYLPHQAMLLQLAFNEATGKPRSIHREIHLLEKIR